MEFQSSFIPWDGLQARHGPKHLWSNKKIRQSVYELLCLFESAVGNDESLAFFSRALPGNPTSGTTGAKKHNPQISEVDRKLSSDGTGKANPIRVEADKFACPQSDGVDCTGLFRFSIELVQQIDRSDLVGHGEIHARELQLTNKLEGVR